MSGDQKIGLPRKILYRGTPCGLSDEVLGAPSGSRRVSVTPRSAAVTSGEAASPETEACSIEKISEPEAADLGAMIGAAAISVVDLVAPICVEERRGWM